MSQIKGIQSLEIGMSILDVFLREKKPMTFMEIQEQTGITKSNLYKYIHSLLRTGMLYRDPTNSTYVLGNKLIEFGNEALQSFSLVERVSPYLEAISKATAFTSLLAVWSQGKPIIVKIHGASFGLNIGAQLGTSLPLLSSTGKVFSAFLQAKDKEEWELQELSVLSEQRRKEFLMEKEKTIENLFSYSINPLVEHVSSVSTPILNAKNNLIAALTIVGFTPQVPSDPQNDTIQYIIDTARDISKSFGYDDKI